MQDLKQKCLEAYQKLLAPDETGYPTLLNSLTITDFTFAVSEITGIDFFTLHEGIVLKDADNFDEFWVFLQRFMSEIQ